MKKTVCIQRQKVENFGNSIEQTADPTEDVTKIMNPGLKRC